MDFTILLYIFFGILPSTIWLFYYLTKDLHPEPKRMILKIFIWGALITVPVFFIQIGLMSLLGQLKLDPFAYSLIYWFVVIAFSEELFKYVVIKFKVLNSADLDEPLDIMLYMVVAALGFAALENTLYLFAPNSPAGFDAVLGRVLAISIIRFLGATFLHTLCSAIVGYFMAISFCQIKKGGWVVASGILGATILHGLYDFSIMTLDGPLRVTFPVIILLTLAWLVFSAFSSLKQMKSICVIKK